ncbi:hypothetical protein ACFX13_018854 [Malus domestica]
MNASLSRLFSLEEIKDAVFNLRGLKALGPNGFQGVFFQSFWDIIVEEVNGLVSDFVNGKTSLKTINSTHIVLIPKIHNPKNVR